MKRYLKILHERYVVVPIDKAANNIAVICKCFYVLRLLQEIGVIGIKSPTYQLSEKNRYEIIDNNIQLSEQYGLKLTEKQKSLPTMYWTPKMHYTPSRARFIVSSAVCSTKPLSRIVLNTFKHIFNQVRSFHAKSKFYQNYNFFG